MTETITNITALPDILFNIFKTEEVILKESNEGVFLTPVKEKVDCTIGLRGLLADCEEMSVDNFLSRQHADKELDL